MAPLNQPEVVIVGAGHYWLSIAAHLQQRGIAFRIFGIPMQTWQTAMPKGMFLIAVVYLCAAAGSIAPLAGQSTRALSFASTVRDPVSLNSVSADKRGTVRCLRAHAIPSCG